MCFSCCLSTAIHPSPKDVTHCIASFQLLERKIIYDGQTLLFSHLHSFSAHTILITPPWKSALTVLDSGNWLKKKYCHRHKLYHPCFFLTRLWLPRWSENHNLFNIHDMRVSKSLQLYFPSDGDFKWACRVYETVGVMMVGILNVGYSTMTLILYFFRQCLQSSSSFLPAHQNESIMLAPSW